MASIRMPNEGAFQILKGSIGDLATFASQYAKPVMWTADMIRRGDLVRATPPCEWCLAARELV